MIDEATKFMAAFLLKSEKAIDYISALERCWISHFGAPTKLITDEGRGWLHCSPSLMTKELPDLAFGIASRHDIETVVQSP